MPSFSIYTLGCKLNQLESEALADAFHREGFELLPWGTGGAYGRDCGANRASFAGLLVINTCTVTSMAEQKARRMIRKSLRENPGACLIVTGCYAQLEKAAIEGLDDGSAGNKGNPFPPQPLAPRRLFVVPGDAKSALLELPRFLHDAARADGTIPAGPESEAGDLRSLIEAWVRSREAGGAGDEAGAFRFVPGDFSSHSRGFLKIQDGCDRHCSYCRVTLARGPSVSLSAEKALTGLRGLEEQGYGEAVLTGVNIGQYHDQEGRDLGGLLDYLLAGSNNIRIRLSSLEPDGLNGSLIRALAHPRLRPHFHLSIQSGSPLILGRMGRPYGPDEVEKAAALLRNIKTDPFLACDIITGFPGETTAEFEKTYELCRKIGFAWIHAFPYSRRPGTAAWSFKDPVSEREAAERVAALLRLAKQGRREYISRWIGKEVEAIVEGGDEKNALRVQATSENYLKLLIDVTPPPPSSPPGTVPAPGTLLRCRIRGLPGGEAGQAAGRFDAAAEIAD
ncbi:tRNA (N(6)-L-threonylcarbamoyladenosine(37)-C(2))-methylthiotransferase MtaB [Spirochaetia bacterium]|nr:tRNA (N(6)-L-threonylcarbamoyladenosine(37)-C(2))-methylthiotransferase MtaB [Spirochaetia bacterium]